MEFIDLQLGIPPSSWAVLHLLTAFLPDEVERRKVSTDTRPWYNGRHKGFVVIVSRPLRQDSLLVAFGECPSSDDIRVDVWEQPLVPYQAPSVESREYALGDKEPQQKTFTTANSAANFVYKTIEKWAKRC